MEGAPGTWAGPGITAPSRMLVRGGGQEGTPDSESCTRGPIGGAWQGGAGAVLPDPGITETVLFRET